MAESVSSSGRAFVRNLVGFTQVVLIVVMLALLIRVVFEFFGALHAGRLWIELKRYTDLVTLPIPIRSIRAAQYGGSFNVRVTLSLVIYLVVEYLVTGLRRRF